MSNRVILRQFAFALCVFICVTVLIQIETPWSDKVHIYLQYMLSEESNIDFAQLKGIQIANLGLGDDLSNWTEDVTGSLNSKLLNLSAKVREQVKNLVSRWAK